jgi:phosphoserine phosphatase RsbU/P
MKSLSVQVTILYVFLAVLNISFFTIIIFENQIDIIMENIRYRTKEIANNIYSRLSGVTDRINGNPGSFKTEETIIHEINANLNNIIEKYTIFKEDRTILYQSDKGFALNESNLLDALRAFKNKEFIGQFYYSRINEKTREIYFYVPLNLMRVDNAILFFTLEMKDINNRIFTLYGMVFLIICIIAVFHVIFGFVLNRLVISPIRVLSGKSIEISNGNLGARVRIKKKNEIGKLANAFDTMADSIQEKINRLDQQNKKMHMDLAMARQVQNSIYPSVRENEMFRLAIYHRPLIEVSGDYHDIFTLGNGRFGFLIVDVSGHGVSAALITMLIKQLFEKMVNKYKDTKFLFRYVNDELGNLVTTFDKFFTAFYLILDQDKKLIFSNAGHPKAYVLRPNPLKIAELDTDGAFIGFSKKLSERFTSKCIQLQSNDKIILTTDGISETLDKDNNEYGIKRFLEVAEQSSGLSCEEMLQKVVFDFNSFIDETKRRDDETIMIIEIK